MYGNLLPKYLEAQRLGACMKWTAVDIANFKIVYTVTDEGTMDHIRREAVLSLLS
jgi:hypothetical protein